MIDSNPDLGHNAERLENINLVVDLTGLVEIFGDALYDEFGAVVRELVQNSHDAIMDKLSKAGESAGILNSQRIDVVFSQADGFLCIADTGLGMKREELAENLNNFAKSKKRSLQKQLQDESASRHLQLIGEYGVGFLAAMAASLQVEVISKTKLGEMCCWTYKKGQTTAKVSTASSDSLNQNRTRLHLPPTDAGTLVSCQLSDEVIQQYHVNEDSIRASLIHYGQILPVPLFFNGEPISCTVHAWTDPAFATEEDWNHAIETMKGEKPLLVIPVYSPPGELDLQGALWIPRRSSLHGDAYLDIYVKRMYVLSDDNVLFPSWARFLVGFVNSNKIKRIVSGTTVKNDNHAAEVRTFLKLLIIDTFKALRARPEEDYWRIVGPHDDVIKESAVDSDEFMECVWDKLRIKVRSRMMTVPEYLSAVERKTGRRDVAYYFENPMQEFAANLVADSTGVPVLCLCGRANELFIRGVCQRESIELQSFRALADDHFHLPENNLEMKSLVDACAESNIAAEIRTYEPAHVPAVLIEDKTMLERREDLLRGLRVHGERRFVEDLQRLFNAQKAANSGVAFYINAANDLVKALVHAPFDTQSAVCLALYNISFMAAMPELKKAEVQAIYNSISTVLMRLLKTSGEVSPIIPNSPPLLQEDTTVSRPIRIFMIVPYSTDYTNVIAAVREVFEDAPYFFEVTLAKDYMLESTLLDSMRAHMRQADAFIADITSLNPNVMLELGAVLISTDGRPVFALRGQASGGEVPADIRSELFIPYGQPTDDASSIASRIRDSIERNGKPSHSEIIALLKRRSAKALTKYALENLRYRLRPKEIGALLKTYETAEALLEASTDDAALKVGMRPRDVEIVKGEIAEKISEGQL